MNKIYYIIFLILIMSNMMTGCKKPYLPAITASGQSYLVVEGAINTGQDSTIIHLTHTVAVSTPDGTPPVPELNAAVEIQSDANSSYPLKDAGNGYYVTAGLNLNAANKYKLKITTSNNKVYQSDLVTVKNSPPIDSISYQFKANSMQINANTHDPSNNTRYYRWDYTETWVFHSAFTSFLILQKTPVDTIVQRPPDQEINTCWQSEKSSDIILGSTAKLASDVLINSPVTNVASSAEKISSRYSILVKQYALTPEAFNYYQQLRKNTEELGSIFAAQPSSLTGNIHCVTDPTEQVIGYISAGSVSQKRIYINRQQLPAGEQWHSITPYDGCLIDKAYFVDPKTGQNRVNSLIHTGIEIPLQPIALPGQPPIGFTASSPECVDCTLRGTNKQPAFWTDQ